VNVTRLGDNSHDCRDLFSVVPSADSTPAYYLVSGSVEARNFGCVICPPKRCDATLSQPKDPLLAPLSRAGLPDSAEQFHAQILPHN
jgi:hypothetical protein